jgi:GrpB-like predicted nucleotidyltransferase (UPF0157 family)
MRGSPLVIDNGRILHENLKRELAARFDEIGPYAGSKSEFVQSILAKARIWQEGR